MMADFQNGQNRYMETASERRRRKLRWVVDNLGGLAKVAEAAKMNPRTIHQIMVGTLLPAKQDGSRSPRSLGDSSARAIEDAFPQLGRGWFDAPDEASQADQSTDAVPADDLIPRLATYIAGVDEDGRRAIGSLLEALAGNPANVQRIARQIRALVEASEPPAEPPKPK